MAALISNIWQGAYCGAASPITSGGPTGPCNFCDGLVVTANVVQYLWQIAFVLAVAMIIWGAFQLMTSGGSETKVSQGKKTMTSAVVGLVIALTAWLIVNELIMVLSGNPGLPWSQVTCG